MTYDPMIPKVTESPQQSAPEIETNFDQFAKIFSRSVLGVTYNHLPLNDFNQGKHGAVIIENSSADPGVTQNLSILYNKNAASFANTQPQLFAQIPKFLPTIQDTTNASNLGMQLTYNEVNMAGPMYQSFLIGGYLVYIGASLVETVITLTPTPTSILSVQVQNATNPLIFVTVTQPNLFTIKSSEVSTPNWMVVAKA